jgi:hypothetical protein
MTDLNSSSSQKAIQSLIRVMPLNQQWINRLVSTRQLGQEQINYLKGWDITWKSNHRTSLRISLFQSLIHKTSLVVELNLGKPQHLWGNLSNWQSELVIKDFLGLQVKEGIWFLICRLGDHNLLNMPPLLSLMKTDSLTLILILLWVARTRELD